MGKNVDPEICYQEATSIIHRRCGASRTSKSRFLQSVDIVHLTNSFCQPRASGTHSTQPVIMSGTATPINPTVMNHVEIPNTSQITEQVSDSNSSMIPILTGYISYNILISNHTL